MAPKETNPKFIDLRDLSDDEKREWARAQYRRIFFLRSKSPDLRAGGCARASDKGTLPRSTVDIEWKD